MHVDSVRILAARLGVSESQVEEALSTEGLSLGPEQTRTSTASRTTLATTEPLVNDADTASSDRPPGALDGLLGLHAPVLHDVLHDVLHNIEGYSFKSLLRNIVLHELFPRQL